MRTRKSLFRRFCDKIRLPNQPDGCWEWLGAKVPRGYGCIQWGDRLRRSHQVSYEMFVGPVLPGHEIDHLCRNRGCCNPDHLEQVSHRENVLRGCSPAAKAATITHCSNGHELTDDNVYRPAKHPNARHCRTCKAARAATPDALAKARARKARLRG